MDPPPSNTAAVTIRDNRDYIRVLIFLLYHYYRVGGPPKVCKVVGGLGFGV